MRKTLFVICLRTLAIFMAACFLPTNSQAEPIDYLSSVKPILKAHCYSCHGPLKKKAGLRVDTAAFLRTGGDSGPSIVSGDANKSVLIHALLGSNDIERMPHKADSLKADEIAAIRQWITEGAKAPANEQAAKDPRDHWAFTSPVRPTVPTIKRQNWVINPIDAFIAAKHESHHLEPQPDADGHVLLRRAYLDLTGLPPTPAQLDAFAADTSPQAYEKVVDDLLASKHFGERWGRHWMDIWRYSDWYGYKNELRASARFIWRWRDWIVESLNANKPYGEMIIEMLAADEAKPLDRDALRATGFLVRNYYKFNRDVWLDATVEHTGKAFLGITMNCAKCHDHMYDPISQVAYYQFRAIFEPYGVRTDRVAGQPDVTKDGLPRVFDEKLEAVTYVYERGNDKMPRKDQKITPAYPKALGGPAWKAESIKLPPEAYYPGLLEFVANEAIADAVKARDAAKRKLDVAEEKIDANVDAVHAAKDALAVAEADLVALNARLAAERARVQVPPPVDVDALRFKAAEAWRHVSRLRAKQALATAESAQAKAEKLPDADKGAKAKKAKSLKDATAALAKAKKTLASLEKPIDLKNLSYPQFSKTYPETSTGRRLALAKWIAHKRNPLTARVAVNHIWTRHFGKPLVASTFDFGMNGQAPTHPQLLDWLAVELLENDCNLKHIHRLIVTSRTYRMRSTTGSVSESAVAADNQYYARMNPRRLEGEVVRDALLSVAGQLDTKMGGPDLDEDAGMTSYRRSIYFRHAFEKQMGFLQIFDAASPGECYRRAKTVVPQQALALANSTLAMDMARALATDLSKASKADDAMFVRDVFKRVLCRTPNEAEMAACLAFIIDQKKVLKSGKGKPHTSGPKTRTKPSADANQRAREGLVQVLFNHHEFVTIR